MTANLPFSSEEYGVRVARTAESLQTGLDVLIAFANKVMPGYVRYLEYAVAITSSGAERLSCCPLKSW
jgi:hypothetical protein